MRQLLLLTTLTILAALLFAMPASAEPRITDLDAPMFVNKASEMVSTRSQAPVRG
jgi:hypothetical protein